MKALLVFLLLYPLAFLAVQNPPQVEIVNVSQTTDGSKIIDVIYNLTELENELCEVRLVVSVNGGQSYDLIPSPNRLSGAVGENISPGPSHHIYWDLGGENYDLDANNFWFKVIAEDHSSPGFPVNFVFVPGSTFNWHGSNITISSFWVDKYEITQFEYELIMKYNPGLGYGTGAQYPIYRISWFNCIEYCNRRSIREGLEPVYYYDDYGGYPGNWPAGWDNNSSNHDLIECDWSANGYRLLSYLEWVYTARGGASSNGYTYAGSDTLDAVAWYVANSGGQSHIVGTKQENELGIYDMTGNVWEWVWDRWDTSWNPGDCTDPHGPNTGPYHVTSGGSYSTAVQYCPISWYNCGLNATSVYWNTGFRVCRNAD